MDGKRERQWEEDDDEGRKRARESAPPTFKLLAPKSLASAIQFSSEVIESAAGGTVQITAANDLYPQTESQVVVIQGSSWENVMSGLRHVLQMVDNCSECVMPGHDEERRLAMVMPSKSVSALIGVKGANVKELQNRTGCHVHVDGVAIGFGPGGDRSVSVNGNAEALEGGIQRCVEVLKEFCDQAWYPRWANRTNQERLQADQAPPLKGGKDLHEDGGGMGKGGGKGGGNMMGWGDGGGCGMGGNMGGCGMGGMGGCGMGGMGGCGMGGMGGMGCNDGWGMGNMGGGWGGQGGGWGGGMGGCGMGGNMGGCGMGGNMGGCGMGGNMGGNMGGCGMGGCGMGGNMGGCGMGGNMGGCGMGGGMGGMGDDMGAEMVRQVMQEMPSFIVQDPRGFVLRSAVPGQMAMPLQKRGMQVMSNTGTKISIQGDMNSPTQMMSVEGPLFNVCAAYMLMMRAYLELERG